MQIEKTSVRIERAELLALLKRAAPFMARGGSAAYAGKLYLEAANGRLRVTALNGSERVEYWAPIAAASSVSWLLAPYQLIKWLEVAPDGPLTLQANGDRLNVTAGNKAATLGDLQQAGPPEMNPLEVPNFRAKISPNGIKALVEAARHIAGKREPERFQQVVACCKSGQIGATTGGRLYIGVDKLTVTEAAGGLLGFPPAALQWLAGCKDGATIEMDGARVCIQAPGCSIVYTFDTKGYPQFGSVFQDAEQDVAVADGGALFNAATLAGLLGNRLYLLPRAGGLDVRAANDGGRARQWVRAELTDTAPPALGVQAEDLLKVLCAFKRETLTITVNDKLVIVRPYNREGETYAIVRQKIDGAPEFPGDTLTLLGAPATGGSAPQPEREKFSA